MRSVIMNPPTTLIIAVVTATRPNNWATVLGNSWLLLPAITSEPTSGMPEMALVAAISGVCSSGETRPITSKPREAGQHEDEERFH